MIFCLCRQVGIKCLFLLGYYPNPATLFIIELVAANDVYHAKLSRGKAADKTIRTLGWKVDDLSRLGESGRALLVHCQQLHSTAEGDEEGFFAANVPRQLSQLREKLLFFIQGVYRFRRTAATHIFVVMISPEQRNRKPYALPVQCVPYATMKHQQCRNLVNKLIDIMEKKEMMVAGKL